MRCPSCGMEYSERPALSRRDNFIEICPICGMIEAMEDAGFTEEQKRSAIEKAGQIKES